ncbi:MAG: M20/M25/M40 family metallo-hydrolase [Gemmatimonadota bacterium]
MQKTPSRVYRIAGLSLVLASVACSQPGGELSAQTDPTAAAEAAATITIEDLQSRIGALADDSMRGRDTPSPELEKAARHIGRQFREFGLEPIDGDSYLQTYPLTLTAPGPASAQTVVIDGPGGGAIPAEAMIAVPGGRLGSVDGPVVVTTAADRSALGGDVAVLHVTQDGMQAALGAVRGILDRGAGGLLLSVDAPDFYLQGLRRFFDREQLSVGVVDELLAPVVLVSHAALPEGLQAAIGSSGSTTGYAATVTTSASIRETLAFNTIGWIEGSDPDLRDEYVVFSAHMDHVGVGEPVDGDSIYNGADDDASGTAAVIELAEAFASMETPPRRSLVFLLVSGEEKGLLGSEWYAEHPVFPLESTVANLNIDMIGRNWQDTVVAIGRDESSLGETLEDVVADRTELGLTMIDDPWPEERFYFRSDHYNFARNGVPILFFFTGTHADYHGLRDEPDRILYDKTSRIARLIFYLGLEIADADGRPVWDQAAYRRVVQEGGR